MVIQGKAPGRIPTGSPALPKYLRIAGMAFILLSVGAGEAVGQENLQVFGFAQVSFEHYENQWEYAPPEGEENYRFNSMGVNQLNLMLSEGLGGDFSAFLNAEFINDFSSSKGFGAFSLQEAYVRWDIAGYLRIRFGMVIPQFNAMYEIYNRTPLYPYVIRPKLYEASTGNLANIFDMLPQKALLQVNGSIPLGDVVGEYSLFLGNPPDGFISSPANDLIPGYVAYGQSAVNYVSYGGRLGICVGEDLRAGVSWGADVENLRRMIKDGAGTEVNLGDHNRHRLGADLSLTAGRFTLEGEFLTVATPLSGAVRDSILEWHRTDPYTVGEDFDRYFYYLTLMARVSEPMTLYLMVDNLQDDSNPFYYGQEGYLGFHAGVSYGVTEALILKVQGTFDRAVYDTGEPVHPVRKFTDTWLSAGFSISF